MFHALHAFLGNAPSQAAAQAVAGAFFERITLLLNHVLASESVATRRLIPHSGRCICLHFEGWPGWLPPLPRLVFRITPAGLLEWCGVAKPLSPSPEPDLHIKVITPNPALAAVQALAGVRPQIDIEGDSALAADLNWLFDNLRWDIQDDLAQAIGPVPAREFARLGSGIAAALRAVVRGVSSVANTAGFGRE
jgi:ubiquinone biosynthesis accessory factor UbiJ